ncbi:hypothetical protein NXX34_01370 [Bacteroides fragilis]|nr:hypothetical protein [Bacteroides fragilis]
MHVFNRGRIQVDSTRFTSMGQRLKIHFGDRMYTIAFTSYARRNTDGGIRDPLSTLSLEYLLHQRKVGFAYLNFNELPVDSRWRRVYLGFGSRCKSFGSLERTNGYAILYRPEL